MPEVHAARTARTRAACSGQPFPSHALAGVSAGLDPPHNKASEGNMLRRDVLKGIAVALRRHRGRHARRRRRRTSSRSARACRWSAASRRSGVRRSPAPSSTCSSTATTVAGKKIELIVRDDTGVPDVARRIVQDMIVNDKVNIVLGGITPTALSLQPTRHAGEDPDGGHHLGCVDHDRPLALHDAHELHARPVVRRSWASGRPRTAARRSSRW